MTNNLQYKVERLTRAHDVAHFSSGVAAIDNYLKQFARQDMRRYSSVVFVALDIQENIVRGYYSLCSLSIHLAKLPEDIIKKLPKYPKVPATLLGRLGVDQKYREKVAPQARLGEFLLMNAQKTALEAAQNIASAIFIIDVLEPSEKDIEQGAKDPLHFYTQYGFRQFKDNPRKLYKPMQTIQQEFDAIARAGWAQASKKIAKAKEDKTNWTEFANAEDKNLEW